MLCPRYRKADPEGRKLEVSCISLIPIDETLWCAGRPLSWPYVWCEIPRCSNPSFQQVPLESVICKIHILHLKKIDLSDDADSLLDKGRLLYRKKLYLCFT